MHFPSPLEEESQFFFFPSKRRGKRIIVSSYAIATVKRAIVAAMAIVVNVVQCRRHGEYVAHKGGRERERVRVRDRK